MHNSDGTENDELSGIVTTNFVDDGTESKTSIPNFNTSTFYCKNKVARNVYFTIRGVSLNLVIMNVICFYVPSDRMVGLFLKFFTTLLLHLKRHLLNNS